MRPVSLAAAAREPEPEPPARLGSRWRRTRVAVLKVALPLIAVATLTLVAFWSTLWPGTERLRLRGAIAVADLAEGSDAVLDTTLTGFDAKGRPFQIEAAVVRNIGSQQKPMLLSAPRGELTLKGGGRLTITANDGRYDRHAEQVDLSGAVTLTDPSGYQMRSSVARIDLPSGEASGDKPVRVEGPLGTLNAEGFRVTDNGRVVNFTGRSRMLITPREPSSH
ncbi:MAG: LPS export ABC transporter periplasmic protein LptC [Rhodospirillales bacterium]|nr:LPS export ABC transporter periplasmic protein LptC [Rhodospirillales bacterium]